jgi:integrase
MEDEMVGKKKRIRKKHPFQILTAVKIRNAKPGRYADGNGLYLIVDESGARRWVLRTVIHGKRCELGLGGLALVSLAEAREEATRLRKIARKNGDPLAERRKERTLALTFEKAAREAHKAYAESFKARHANRWLVTLETYAFPVIGKQSVEAIEPNDILRVLSSIWISKPETARRVKQRIASVFAWCITKGFRTKANPTDRIEAALPKHDAAVKEHHSALPYGDVPAFIESLKQTSMAEGVRLAFEFLILTAARTSEVLFAKWNEIDLNSNIWTVPKERMKTKIAHRVPLSPRCLEILKAAKEISLGDDYIFPGRKPNSPLSTMALLMALRRMERTDITAHGFRSSFRDWAEERTKYKRNVIEKCLAHTITNKVEESYQRSDLLELRRPVMDSWAAFATMKRAEKVVKMRA